MGADPGVGTGNQAIGAQGGRPRPPACCCRVDGAGSGCAVAAWHLAPTRGSGGASIAIGSLRPGRCMIGASTPAALPGLTLRLSAAWFR